MPYGQDTIGKCGYYQVYRSQLLKLYQRIDSLSGSKVNTTFGMEIPNWRKKSKLHEEDFSAQVIQLNKLLMQYNDFAAKQKTLSELQVFMQCQLYVAAYELAGEKLKMIFRMLSGHPTDKVRTAIEYCRANGLRLLVSRFDFDFRNALAHNTFLYVISPKPLVAAVDRHLDHGYVTCEPLWKTKRALDIDTVCIILFLWACLSVNASRYVGLVDDCFLKVP